MNQDDNHTQAYSLNDEPNRKILSEDVCLIIIKGKTINQRFDLYRSPDKNLPCNIRQEFKIGRLEGVNQIVITDDQISREHGVIIQDGMKFFINDLGSTNGTFVNDEKVVGIIRLYNQDRIRLGNTIIKFLQGDIEAEFLSHLKSRES